MPVRVPSVEDVQSAFRQAVTNAIPQHQESDSQEYDRAYRSLTASVWTPVSPGIESVSISLSSWLIRGSWEYTIDPHTDGQFPIITAQARAFAASLSSLVPPNASVALTLAPAKASAAPIGQRVECSFTASICICGAECPTCGNPCLCAPVHLSGPEGHYCQNDHQY